jgi:hypothetical protein
MVHEMSNLVADPTYTRRRVDDAMRAKQANDDEPAKPERLKRGRGNPG